jgi:hypothetical protein
MTKIDRKWCVSRLGFRWALSILKTWDIDNKKLKRFAKEQSAHEIELFGVVKLSTSHCFIVIIHALFVEVSQLVSNTQLKRVVFFIVALFVRFLGSC